MRANVCLIVNIFCHSLCLTEAACDTRHAWHGKFKKQNASHSSPPRTSRSFVGLYKCVALWKLKIQFPRTHAQIHFPSKFTSIVSESESLSRSRYTPCSLYRVLDIWCWILWHMDSFRRDVLDVIHFKLVRHIAGSLHTHQGSPEVIWHKSERFFAPSCSLHSWINSHTEVSKVACPFVTQLFNAKGFDVKPMLYYSLGQSLKCVSYSGERKRGMCLSLARRSSIAFIFIQGKHLQHLNVRDIQA